MMVYEITEADFDRAENFQRFIAEKTKDIKGDWYHEVPLNYIPSGNKSGKNVRNRKVQKNRKTNRSN